MEFVLSRVSAVIIAAMIMIILIEPVTGLYEDDLGYVTSDTCKDVGDMMDSFMMSEADTMTLNLAIILPGADSSVSFSGNIVTMESNGEKYECLTTAKMESDKTRYNSNDVLIINKEQGRLFISSGN